MPAAIDTLPDLGQANADIKTMLDKLDEVAEHLLKKSIVIGEAVQGARASVAADLGKGVEVRQFARALAKLKKYGSDVLEVYAAVRKPFADWQREMETLDPLINEAEAFVAWLDELLVRLNRPAPHFEESRLPPAPDSPTAEGYLSLSEARARAGKKP
jgi:hypothetical protein